MAYFIFIVRFCFIIIRPFKYAISRLSERTVPYCATILTTGPATKDYLWQENGTERLRDNGCLRRCDGRRRAKPAWKGTGYSCGRRERRPVRLYMAFLLDAAPNRSCMYRIGKLRLVVVHFRHAPCPKVFASGGWVADCRGCERDEREPSESKSKTVRKGGSAPAAKGRRRLCRAGAAGAVQGQGAGWGGKEESWS